MNRKGFTLIELMAVIIILAIVSVAVVPSILKQVAKTEKTSKCRAVELINAASTQFASDHNIKDTVITIHLSDLYDGGYLKRDSKFVDYGYSDSYELELGTGVPLNCEES